LFEATYKLGLERIVSKKLNAPYRSGPSRTFKVKKSEGPCCNSRYWWDVLAAVQKPHRQGLICRWGEFTGKDGVAGAITGGTEEG
jgi:hypothetical protein